MTVLIARGGAGLTAWKRRAAALRWRMPGMGSGNVGVVAVNTLCASPPKGVVARAAAATSGRTDVTETQRFDPR